MNILKLFAVFENMHETAGSIPVGDVLIAYLFAS